MQRRILSLTSGVLLLVACSATAPETVAPPVLPPAAPTTPVPASAWPTQAWLDRSLDLASYDAAELAAIASRPLLVVQLRLLLSEEARAPLATLRALNPDLVVVGILQVLSVPEIWDDAGQRQRFPLGGELYDFLSDRLARTTTGATPLMWADAPMVNPYRAGSHDAALVERVLDTVSLAAQDYPRIDGIFHDYLSGRPFIYPQQGNVGEVDLDADGVGANSDPQDQAAWIGYQRALVAGFQSRFGSGLIQIGNGRLPHDDAVVAGWLAGIAYENFPTTVWGYSDREGMDLMLEHHAPGWLTPRRGRTWSLLWDRRGSALDFCRAASALCGQFYVKTDLNGFAGSDAWHGSLGLPTGSLLRTELPDGSVQYTRELSLGAALIETDPSGAATRRELLPD